jgi:hypothetical protein
VRERKTAMIDAKDWLWITDAARVRNERALLKLLPPIDGENLGLLKEVLAETDLCAIESAHLAAWKAYIAAFNEAYDKGHREAYAVLSTPSLEVRRTPVS